jgi:peptide/nickel transport system substrate-binding protein
MLLLALSVLPAGPRDARAQPPSELRVGIRRLPDALEPAAGGPGVLVLRQLFQGLVEIGERGDIEPGLATSWTVSRDGLTWTFRLRPDVQFHNGTPVTPDLVVASLARHLGPDQAGAEPAADWERVFRGPAAVVREVRRGDPGTVEIQLTQPFSPLLAVLAHPAVAIAQPSDQPGAAVGTGPYRLAERAPGRVVLEAVAPGRSDGPRMARIVFEEMADDAAALAELGPGRRLDVQFAQSPPAWGGLGLQVMSGPTWQTGLLALRARDGVLARKPIRQAVALALDPALVGPALGRWARPWAAYLPPGAWAARELSPTAHDPARARRLLAETRAGSPSLTLLAGDLPGGPDPGRLTEAIRLSLAVAGFKVLVRQPAAEAYDQALRSGEGELALHERVLEIDDPHFGLRPLLASEFAVRGSASNVAFYRNPLVDNLLLRGSQFAFRPERLRLYQRLQQQAAEDFPYIPLYARLQWAVARPGVRGIRLDPAGRHRLDRVWLDAPPALPLPAPPPAAPPAPVVPPAPVLPAPVVPPALPAPGLAPADAAP